MRICCGKSICASFYWGISLALSLQVSATCYWPNGTAHGDGAKPCKATGQSMCCDIDPAVVDPAHADTCRSDGLCIPSDNSGVWRGLCTDPTWKDPACLDLCTSGQCTSVSHDVSTCDVANIYFQPSTIAQCSMRTFGHP